MTPVITSKTQAWEEGNCKHLRCECCREASQEAATYLRSFENHPLPGDDADDHFDWKTGDWRDIIGADRPRRITLAIAAYQRVTIVGRGTTNDAWSEHGKD